MQAIPGNLLARLAACSAGGSWRLASTQQQCLRAVRSSPSAEAAGTSGRPFCAAAAGSAAQDDSSTQARLLDAALRHVDSRGWTGAALVAAARELGLSPAVVGLLPRREGQLVEHFIACSNARLMEALKLRAAELQALPVQDRVRVAIKLRLEMVQPHIGSWPQALAVAALPTNLPHSAPLLGQLVDGIWYAVGDTSTDTSWYTKRAALAAVYSASELYMLSDYSPHYAETWAALDRRLSDLLALGKAAKSVRDSVASYMDAAARHASANTGAGHL